MNDYYYFSLCLWCKSAKAILKKCSKCRVAYYCSSDHQRQDWSGHKKLCKAIAKSCENLSPPAPNCTPEQFNQHKSNVALLWRLHLDRDLSQKEQQMCMFPKICSVCFNSRAEIICEKCLSVAYCSSDHREKHKELHEKFCFHLQMHLYILQNPGTNLDLVDINFIGNPEVLGKDLEATMTLLNIHKPQDFSDSQLVYFQTSELFYPACNLIFALEQSGFILKRQAKKNSLVIHIVGAGKNEESMFWPMIAEFLYHWIRNLEQIQIYLIGPQLTSAESFTFPMSCLECQRKQFVVKISQKKGLYHKVQIAEKPDLVVAFNSGLHEFAQSLKDSWGKSIQKLIEFNGVPTVLTAYTLEELEKDLARFSDSISYIVAPQRNPYSSLKPQRNWEEGTEPIFYNSAYIAIITRVLLSFI